MGDFKSPLLGLRHPRTKNHASVFRLLGMTSNVLTIYVTVFGRSNEISETRISNAPNVQTMAAPEGKSHQNERKSTPTPPIKAMSQPIRSLLPSEPARLIPQTAGTIR